eukprot:1173025-Pleurochrysis_carterae.AAC.3
MQRGKPSITVASSRTFKLNLQREIAHGRLQIGDLRAASLGIGLPKQHKAGASEVISVLAHRCAKTRAQPI